MAVDRGAAPTPPLAPLQPGRQSRFRKSKFVNKCQLATGANFSDNSDRQNESSAHARAHLPACENRDVLGDGDDEELGSGIFRDFGAQDGSVDGLDVVGRYAIAGSHDF